MNDNEKDRSLNMTESAAGANATPYDDAAQDRIRIHSHGMRMRPVCSLLRKFAGIFGSLRYRSDRRPSRLWQPGSICDGKSVGESWRDRESETRIDAHPNSCPSKKARSNVQVSGREKTLRNTYCKSVWLRVLPLWYEPIRG